MSHGPRRSAVVGDLSCAYWRLTSSQTDGDALAAILLLDASQETAVPSLSFSSLKRRYQLGQPLYLEADAFLGGDLSAAWDH